MSKTVRRSTHLSSATGASDNPALERLFARMGAMATFSANAQAIVRLSYRSTGSLEDLQHLVQADPSVAALVLRRVNSEYYHLDEEVLDVTSAAHLLGFREFRNLAITVYVSRMFDLSTEAGALHAAGMWVHSVAVAAAAHLVSRVCGRGVPADAYMAGLLHDVGFLLIYRHMYRRFLRLVGELQNDTYLPSLEHAAYAFDHAQLGSYVARQWEFPPAVTDAIQYHHDVDAYTGPHRDLVHVVAATDYLCTRAGWTALGVQNLPLPPDSVYRALGLDQVALAIIWEQLLPTLEKATALAAV